MIGGSCVNLWASSKAAGQSTMLRPAWYHLIVPIPIERAAFCSVPEWRSCAYWEKIRSGAKHHHSFTWTNHCLKLWCLIAAEQ